MNLIRGTKLDINGRIGEVINFDAFFITVSFENHEPISLPSEEYFEKSRTGEIRQVPTSETLTKQARELTDEQVLELGKYKDYVSALIQTEYPGSVEVRKDVIKEVALRRGDTGKNKPSPGTLYNWHQRYIRQGSFEAMVLPRYKKRGHRIDEALEDLFFECLDKHYLILKSQGQKNKQQTFEEFLREFEARKQSSCEKYRHYKNLKPFSRSTFYELVSQLCPYETAVAREGRSEANNKFRYTKGNIIVERPLQRVQIDAVHLNILLTDENGNKMGMPVVYFAICVFTRAIIGYVITIAKKRSEDLFSAMELIKSSINCKSKPEHTHNQWQMFGKIESVQADSGIFVSTQFKLFLEHMEIEHIQTPPKKPWKNAMVERVFRTLRESCCALIPSYVGKSSETKDSSVIKMLALVTNNEFQEILESFIIDIYHQKSHRGLNGQSPAQVWDKYQSLVNLPTPDYIKTLDTFRGIKSARKIQEHKGIQKNKVFYNNQALQSYYHSLKSKDRKNKTTFYYSEADISKISVVNELTGELFIVEAIGYFEPISLREHNAKMNADNRGELSPIVDTMSPRLAAIAARLKAIKDKEQPPEQSDSKSLPDLSDAALDRVLSKNKQNHKIANEVTTATERLVEDERQSNEIETESPLTGKKINNLAV